MKKHSEIMQALLDGKKLTQKLWAVRQVYIHLVDGTLRYQNGNYCTEIDGEYEVYVEPLPPNPWTKGTFQWAHEECARGKKVTRPSFVGPDKYTGYDIRKWFDEAPQTAASNIMATDWEVVS